MPKPAFFYATGTAFFTEIMGLKISPIGGGSTLTASWQGRSYFWDGYITNDPFWMLLDPQRWDSRKIEYPAATFPMGLSIDIGVDMVVEQINALPSGTPFALGGYSQGAAVMSKVYREITGGSLTGRASSFKGGVMFGNPMLQKDFTAPGVTWSGSWDDQGSTTGGSGCFPDRLSNCEYGKWREYVNVQEIITACGDSPLGQGFRSAAGIFLGKPGGLGSGNSLLNILNPFMYAGIIAGFNVGAYGHVGYPIFPPLSVVGETFPPGTPTSFEMALTFLEELAVEVNASPILPITDPSMDKPWTTCRTWLNQTPAPTPNYPTASTGPKINLYSFDGTGSLGGTSTGPGGVYAEIGGQYPQILGKRLQDSHPAIWRWQPVDYHPEYILTGEPPVMGAQTFFPGTIPDAITGIVVPTVSRAVDRAVNLAAASIQSLPAGDKIVLSGLSQGSLAVRVLYEEIMTGALQSRKDDLVGVINFGDACRPPGRTVPLDGAFDPGGEGASVLPMWMPLSQRWTTSGHYVNPPSHYWAFANINDAASCANSTPGPTRTLMARMAKYVLYGAASGPDWRTVNDWTNRSDYIRFYNTIFSTPLAATQNTQPGTDSLIEFGVGVLSSLTSQWADLFPDILAEILKWIPFAGLTPNPHALYNGPSVYTAMNNNNKSAVQLAYEHLSQFSV